MIRETHSEDETRRVAFELAQSFKGGECIALTGPLGAGKTAFTRGIADALGVTEHITSPTYNLVLEYDGRLPLYHFDVYRVEDPDELLEIGFYDYLARGGVTVIEWADLIAAELPPNVIRVSINREEDVRCIRITPSETD